MDKDASGILPTSSVDDAAGLGAVLGTPGSGPAVGLLDFPLNVLLMVLRRVSRARGLGGPLHFALVCRRFAAARFRAAILIVEDSREFSGPDLARELRVYQGPTTLNLGCHSIKGLRAVFRGLATQGPVLTGVKVDWQVDTCLQCEGECPHSRNVGRDSQLCARHGQASAWWAFSGPFLRANPGLRSLSIEGDDHEAGWPADTECEVCCFCSHGPDPAVSIPELRSSLSRLRHLDLDNVNLHWPKDWLSALPPLKSLSLWHSRPACENAGRLDLSPVFSMTSLTSLTLHLGMASFLDFRRLTNLKSLFLKSTNFNLFQSVGEELGRLGGLKKVKLSGVSLESLPGGSLRALERVELRYCKINEFEECRPLRSLSVDEFNGRFPAGLSRLAGLTDLDLLDLWGLEKLPIRFRRLTGLERLHLRKCDALKRLPADFGQLASLTDLCLERLGSLKELPHGFGRLESLRSLKIAFCGLRRLPSDFSQLTSLTDLSLKCPGPLEELPNMRCMQLRRLSLAYLDRLHRSLVPGLAVGPPNEGTSLQGECCLGLGEFQYLQSLKVIDCWALRVIPEHLYKLPLLQRLKLKKALGQGEIDEGFLRGIREVDVEGQAEESTIPLSEEEESDVPEEATQSDSEDEEEE